MATQVATHMNKVTQSAMGSDHSSFLQNPATRAVLFSIALLFPVTGLMALSAEPATEYGESQVQDSENTAPLPSSSESDGDGSLATPGDVFFGAEEDDSDLTSAPDPAPVMDEQPSGQQAISGSELLAGYQQQIDAQLALNGAYDTGLSESLAGMARLLQLGGDHDSALVAYQQAMHIQRVNHGIYSLSQEPMLRGMISSYQAQNNLDEAGQHYEQLLWMYTKTYGDSDPRLVPLAAEISEWHIQAYNQNPNRKGLYHLVASHKLAAQAIDLVTHQFGKGTLTVLPLLRNLVITNFHLADHQRRYPVGSREGFSFRASSGNAMAEPLSQEEILMINSYNNGRRAHERIITTLFENPEASATDRARAIADLGDWYLLFGRTQSAQKAYTGAWQAAEANPIARQSLNRLFRNPRLITPHSLALAPQPAKVADHTDKQYNVLARLAVNARGEVRNAEILETYPADNPELADRAAKNLKKLRFRPRIVEGQMVAVDDYTFKLSMLE